MSTRLAMFAPPSASLVFRKFSPGSNVSRTSNEFAANSPAAIPTSSPHLDLVLVWRLDRWGRSRVDQVRALQELYLRARPTARWGHLDQ